MLNISIRSNESGTMIPNCGLDHPTDKLRRTFRLSITDFQQTFTNPDSPARWLYFLLSNQQQIVAKLHTLETHLETSLSKLNKERVRVEEAMDNQPYNTTNTALDYRFEQINLLKAGLDSLMTRLSAPKEQVEKLKTLRLNKVNHFVENYARIRRQLGDALVTGGMTQFKPEILDKFIAFVFEFRLKEDQKALALTRKQVNPAIAKAINDLIPHELSNKVMNIVSHPQCWSILLCNPNIPIAKEITPVIIDIIMAFDAFKDDHAGIFKGIEILKNAVFATEKDYLETLLSNPVPAVVDESVYELQQSLAHHTKNGVTLSTLAR